MKRLVFFMLLSVQILWGINAAEVYRSISDKYASITSYEADFKQTNYWKEPDVEQDSHGRFLYTEKKLAFIYDHPQGQRIIVTPESITLYDAPNNQVYLTAADKLIGQITPVEALKTYWKKSTAEIIRNKLVLTVHEDSIVRMEIAYDNSYLITDLAYTDNAGNTVRYKFQKAKINTAVDKKAFSFIPPKDAIIIDQREK